MTNNNMAADLISLYNQHVIENTNKEKQVNKKKSYDKMVEDFNRGGGRPPYSEEVDAWESGWNDGFKAGKKKMKDKLKAKKKAEVPLHVY
jgi:hypothetical protein